MIVDPIVKEVHQTRAKLLAEHGGSLRGYLENLKRRDNDAAENEPIRSIEELRRKTIRLAT